MSAAQMQASGFQPEDFDDDILEIWAENLETWLLFRRLRTQWRVGVNGATGLDHNVLLQHLAARDLTAAERNAIVDDIVVMEEAAMAEMRRDQR
jgi:hypothetical protein